MTGFLDSIQPYLNKRSWTQTIGILTNLLNEYPGGMTDTIIQASLELELVNKNNQHSSYESLAMVKENPNTTLSTNFECRVTNIVDSNSMFLLEILDSNGVAMSMMLHSRFHPINSKLLNKQIRFTHCHSFQKRFVNENDQLITQSVILPTEIFVCLIEPTVNPLDGQFLVEQFTHLLEDVDLSGIQNGTQYNLSLQVVMIPQFELKDIDENFSLDLILSDPSGSCILTLYGTQAKLALLISIGDTVYLWNPQFNSKKFKNIGNFNQINLEYGSETVLFLSANKQSIHCLNESFDTPTNFENSKDRILVTNIPTECVNLTIYGRIISHISLNEYGGLKQYHYQLRIQDKSGSCDVTLTDTIARKAIALEVGMFVIISGLSSCVIRDKKHIIGNDQLKSDILCISNNPAIISSSCLHKLIPLSVAIDTTVDFFYCRAAIVSIIPRTTINIHSDCSKPVEIMGVKHFCSTCQILTSDILQIPMMDMVLDDGTLQMEFDLSLHVCRELVHDQGIASLDGLLFETLHFGITNFRNAFRIDQICFDPPIYSQILDWKIDQSKVKRIRH